MIGELESVASSEPDDRADLVGADPNFWKDVEWYEENRVELSAVLD
jgi:hypothetical protein